MNFSVRLLKSVDVLREIDADRSVFQAAVWYELVPHFGDLYVLAAFYENHPIAALPFFLMSEPSLYHHTPSDLFCGSWETQLFEKYGADTKRAQSLYSANWYPCVATISPYGYRGGIIASNKGRSPDVYRAIIAELDRFCQSNRIKMAVHHYLNGDDDGLWMNGLAASGYKAATSGADCNLDMVWNSIEQYFSGLGRWKSKHKSFYLKYKHDPDLTWSTYEDYYDEDCMNQSLDLFEQTTLKYGYSLPREFYRKLMEDNRMSSQLVVCRKRNGELLSAMLSFIRGTTLYPKLIGSKVNFIYFYMIGPCLIEQALRLGLQRIEYGGGSHQAKLNRGADLRLLYAMVKPFQFNEEPALSEHLAEYHRIKSGHFSRMAKEYQSDHAPVLTEPNLKYWGCDL